jgi:hypothetical protein
MATTRNIRRNSDLKFVMLHHSENFESVNGKDINSAFVQEGKFGIPFDIIINTNGKIDLGPRWIRAANPLQYVENAPLYSIFKYTLHDIADACSNQQMNYQALHVLIIGNFDVDIPTIAQINTLEKLIALIRDNVPSVKDLLFHNDVVTLSCPGVRFQDAVRKDKLRRILLPDTKDTHEFKIANNIIPVLRLVDNILPDVNLAWNNINNASYYNVYRINVTLNGNITKIGTSSGTTFADTDIIVNYTYTYYVTAVFSNNTESPLSNAVTTTVSGVASIAALQFDDDGASGDIARTSQYIPIIGGNSYNFTVEMWVRVDSLPPLNVGRLFTVLGGAGGFGFVSDIGGQGLSFTYPNNSIGASGISSGLTFVVGQTHHWAFIFEIVGNVSYYLTVYRDGILFLPKTQKVIPSSSTGTLAVELGRSTGFIGGQNNVTFKVVYDEVRIWDVVRTQSEIQELMNRTLNAPQSGLIGCWGFDNRIGDTIIDASSSGQNMINTGGIFVGGLF